MIPVHRHQHNNNDSAHVELAHSRRQLLANERHMVRSALVAQRSQYAHFVDDWLRPIVDAQLSLLGEFGQVADVTDTLYALAADPHLLPPASEAVIQDIQGVDITSNQSALITANSLTSPTLGSRKSSMCSLATSTASNSCCNSPHHATLGGMPLTSTPLPPAHHHNHIQTGTMPPCSCPCSTPAAVTNRSSEDSGMPLEPQASIAKEIIYANHLHHHHQTIYLPPHSDEDSASSGHTGSLTDGGSSLPAVVTAAGAILQPPNAIEAESAATPSPTSQVWQLDVDRKASQTLPISSGKATVNQRPTILPDRPDSLNLSSEAESTAGPFSQSSSGVMLRPASFAASRPPLPPGNRALRDMIVSKICNFSSYKLSRRPRPRSPPRRRSPTTTPPRPT